MNRKAKLEKALANYNSDSMFSVENYKGAQIENSRLAPLHEALVAAVEALEILNSQLRPIGRYSHQADSALSKIDKVLGDG